MKTTPLILASLLTGCLLKAQQAQTAPPSPPQSQLANNSAQQFKLDELFGDNLINADGSLVDLSSLKNKFVGIYFSAHWCGPCRQFTPKLVEFRNQIPNQFEVVFASADHDASAMLAYMKETAMPWPALPFGSGKKTALDRTFQVRSIPTFVVLDPSGRLVSPNARNDVTTLSPMDALAKWKNDAAKAPAPKTKYSASSVINFSSENRPRNPNIGPSKSILGCPVGSTEEEVIHKLGKPLANLRLKDNKTGLLYFNSTALLSFYNGKLEGGIFSEVSLLNFDYQYYIKEKLPYALSNGIAIGNSLQEAKNILGDQLDLDKNNFYEYQHSYKDGEFIVNLISGFRSDNEKNNLDSYSIYAIEIYSDRYKSIVPEKFIFDCPWGSTEAEIVNKLGEPEGKVDLGSNKTGLLYHNYKSLLILWDGVLGGGLFKTDPMFRNNTPFPILNDTISLKNGIALGKPLAKAKEILGEKLDISETLGNTSYQDGDSLISFQSSCRIPNNVARDIALKDINYYHIDTIQIDPISRVELKSQAKASGIPAKTTFPTRQNKDQFNPLEMVIVKGGTLSEKMNLPGVVVDTFEIGKYEITNAEWVAIQSYGLQKGYSLNKQPRTDHPELPIESVSRREAMAWCNAKSEKEGLQPVYWLNEKIYKSPENEPQMKLDANGYRLPTEPEWEWAARGGIKSMGYQFSGSDMHEEVSWHGDNGEKWARPVGTKKPNELGIYDMTGNVYEWVWDTNIPTFGILGGSYVSGKMHLMLSFRNAGPFRKFAKEVGHASSLGFRVARNHSKDTRPSLTPASYQLKTDNSTKDPEQPPAPKVDLMGLIEQELINAAGERVDPSALKDKMIALYFSAHWKGSCQRFTPKLVDFANKAKKDVIVVFVSSLKDQKALGAYMKDSKMPWPAIPFGSQNIPILEETLHVKSAPTLVILNSSGNLLTSEGQKDVAELNYEECLTKWKSAPPKDPSTLAKWKVPPIFQRTAPARPKDITIDPGKSIFGCKYGATENDVIKKLGIPLGRSEYEGGITELVYGKDCLLYFLNGGLCGANLNDIDIKRRHVEGGFIIEHSGENEGADDLRHHIDGNFIYSSPKSYINNTYAGGWKLSNGIHPKMKLKDAQKILGDDLAINLANPKIIINQQSITFSTCEYKDVELIESLSVFAKDLNTDFTAKKQPSKLDFLVTNPSKSILGCPLGSSPSEIIQTLGKPKTIFQLGDNKEGYLYDKDLLIVWDEKLGGGILKSPSLTLTNGIHLGIPLAEAIAIIGEKFIQTQSEDLSKAYYIDGNSLVTLKSRHENIPFDRSEKQYRPNFIVESIQIHPLAKASNY